MVEQNERINLNQKTSIRLKSEQQMFNPFTIRAGKQLDHSNKFFFNVGKFTAFPH